MIHRVFSTAVAGVLAAMVMAGGSALAGTVQVVVTGMGDFGGRVHIGIFNDSEAFPHSGRIDGTTVPVFGHRVVAEFTDLPPGNYAVAAYYDSDGDGQFTTSALGLPKEKYGFSNRARGFLGPPAFSDAAFEVVEGRRTVVQVDLD